MSDVMRTTDYFAFKTLDGNRNVSEKRVNMIMESIKKIGWVSNPIIVNENMEVIDGQGRLEALKRLAMPVEYRIVKGTSVRECRIMNDANTLWQTAEFVKSYSDTGNKSFQRLQQMIEMYSVTTDVIMKLMNRDRNCNRNGIKSGEFEMTDEEFGKALKRLPIYTAYMKAFKRFKGNGRVKQQVAFFLTERSYPHQMLIDMLKECDPEVIYCSSGERMLECIQKEYNRFKRSGQKIHILEDFRSEE